jgi:hypothetical protein
VTNAIHASASTRSSDDHAGPPIAGDDQRDGFPRQEHARREALVSSLRARYAVAELHQDAEAKQALFKEAAYLGIRPEAYQG